MKQIDVVCYKRGTAKVTTSDVHIDNESLASKIVIDFSDLTDQTDTNKWVDLVYLKTGTSLRYDLGVGDVVEFEMEYETTVAGTLTITPFIYNGLAQKIKFKTNANVTIYKQAEAGTEEAVLRDDFIFELSERTTALETLTETITNGNWSGLSLSEIELELFAIKTRLTALEASAGVVQKVLMTIPLVESVGTIEKIIYDSVNPSSSNTDILDLDIDGDQLIKLSTNGYLFTANFAITKTSVISSSFVVSFYLMDKSQPILIENAFDEIIVAVEKGLEVGTTRERSKSIIVSHDDLVALGLPLSLGVYYIVSEGAGTIDSHDMTALSIG